MSKCIKRGLINAFAATNHCLFLINGRLNERLRGRDEANGRNTAVHEPFMRGARATQGEARKFPIVRPPCLVLSRSSASVLQRAPADAYVML